VEVPAPAPGVQLVAEVEDLAHAVRAAHEDDVRQLRELDPQQKQNREEETRVGANSGAVVERVDRIPPHGKPCLEGRAGAI
jgi:hypothetical protein